MAATSLTFNVAPAPGVDHEPVVSMGDLAIAPSDPDMLWATSWERVRGPWFLENGGSGS